MSESLRVTKVTVAFICIAALLMGFLGTIAGKKYHAWTEARRMEQKVLGLATGEATALRRGEPFPDVAVHSLAGEPTSIGEVIAGNPALVVFLSVDCDVCTEMVEDWSAMLGEIPEDVIVAGVADATPIVVEEYLAPVATRFPVYCDAIDAFGRAYDMDIYPTVVGVTSIGTIAFVRHGINAHFTPPIAHQRLMEAEFE